MRSTKATSAASASANANTPDLSLIPSSQQIAAHTTDTVDATDPPDTLGPTPPATEQAIDTETLEPFHAPDSATTGRVHRVSPEMAAYIVRIKRLRPQIKQSEIAALCGVSQPTVSQWLRALDNDTVPEARKLAKSNALRSVMKLEDQVDHSDPRVSQGAAKALVALAGVQEGAQPVQVGVQVVVGQVGQPAGIDPFEGHNVVVNSIPVSD